MNPSRLPITYLALDRDCSGTHAAHMYNSGMYIRWSFDHHGMPCHTTSGCTYDHQHVSIIRTECYKKNDGTKLLPQQPGQALRYALQHQRAQSRPESSSANGMTSDTTYCLQLRNYAASSDLPAVKHHANTGRLQSHSGRHRISTNCLAMLRQYCTFVYRDSPQPCTR